jgi:hypothetical protein
MQSLDWHKLLAKVAVVSAAVWISPIGMAVLVLFAAKVIEELSKVEEVRASGQSTLGLSNKVLEQSRSFVGCIKTVNGMELFTWTLPCRTRP